jgi:hypothetical protein
MLDVVEQLFISHSVADRISAARSSSVVSGSFYESDCQGRTSSLLIAEHFSPTQSALMVVGRTRPSAAIELAVQSLISSASVLSPSLQRADGHVQALGRPRRDARGANHGSI